jgi:L-histidine N-alpha-methyltransferase
MGPQTRWRLLNEAREQLSLRPPEISPKWFYDARGSELFEAITRLPEYYPTRREREILERRAKEIARLTEAETLIELGSGSSEKTRLLLDALSAQGTLRRLVTFDVSESALRKAAWALSERYPELWLHALVGDFEHDLRLLPNAKRRLIVFLGGTLGNLRPAPRRQFLSQLGRIMNPGDWALIGTDLVKDPARLHAAYNDAAGVTAQFNLNVLNVLNRELRADFDLSQFEHRAFYDEEEQWIEMHLRALSEQHVQISLLKLNIPFAPGDEMLTEISAKFRPSQIKRELEAAGFEFCEWWTDQAGDFGLSLAMKP